MNHPSIPQRNPPLFHHACVWDVMIGVLLVVGASMTIASLWWIQSFRFSLFFGFLGILGFIGFFLTLYGSFIAPQRIAVNKKSVQIAGFPRMTIAVIADFHVGPYKGEAFMRRVVAKINALQPDLVLLPGDFLFDHTADVSALSPLKKLHAPHGVFAIVGNHDMGLYTTFKGEPFLTVDRSDDVTSHVTSLGITVLRDAWQTMKIHDTSLAVAGIDAPWTNMMDCKKTLDIIPATLPVLLLAHNPDVVLDPSCKRASLIVSGHTHGGQFRLPFIGSLHVPAATGRTYDQGIFHIGEHTILAVTHGIGETLARARLFCPPEIMVLDINATAS